MADDDLSGRFGLWQQLLGWLEHMGFLVNTSESVGIFGVPAEHINNGVQIVTAEGDIYQTKMSWAEPWTPCFVRVLAKVKGKLRVMVHVILSGPLHYRQWQMQKDRALLAENHSCKTIMTLTAGCRAELNWWVSCIEQWHGHTLIKPRPDLAVQISTDAPMKGWGAIYQGVATQGLWSDHQQLQHTNVLELKSAFMPSRH